MFRKLVFLVFLAVPLAAQDAQLFIERIEVRNNERVSPHVVIAESRLRAGQSYTESELRDAAARLSRLPFLLSVDFSLEKGSERGNYVLVLSINETRPFFFLVDIVPFFDDDEANLDVTTEDRPGGNRENLALGFRWFVGRRGAVHVGFSGGREENEFTNEYASLVAGYTQYDLFGTRAFATFNLKRPVEGYGEDGIVSPQLVLGVPVTANQTVTLEYDDLRQKNDTGRLDGLVERYGQKVLSARWSYNTTNEPFFPTEGTLLSVTPHYAWTDSETITHAFPDNEERLAVTHGQTYGVTAAATRFRELTERDSVWADLRGKWEYVDRRSDVDLFATDESATAASIGIGYARSLWSREERASGDSRFELTGRYTHRTRNESFLYDHETSVAQLGWSWIRRSSFGTLRLGVGFAW